ncbi:hypothetical protein [Desulfurispira natronophila]|uniref:Carboxypeptidase regulatory-like domain-containing protein n=1 Tax=Desulfurispira natronophila TaxID=682562 RepID=A0A7W8DH24_9BACT|nr:hypothetical protein [Desulfurispira natronophila]MBB5022065.1 hypothetical protein [Desulfurispira natronophila]
MYLARFLMVPLLTGLFLMSFALAGSHGSPQITDYWTGGVGKEERKAAPEGNTLIKFSLKNGSYLAYMEFEVRDRDGALYLKGDKAGPWVVANLPSGSYHATAQRQNGERQSQDFEVRDDRSTQVILSFPE